MRHQILIEIALWLDDENRQTIYMAVTRDTSYDLAKPAQVSDLVNQVEDGRLSLAHGLELLRDIDSAYHIQSLCNISSAPLCVS